MSQLSRIESTRRGLQTLESQNDAGVLPFRIRNPEPAQQDRRVHHVTDSSKFKLSPIWSIDASMQLLQDVPTELRKRQGQFFAGS